MPTLINRIKEFNKGLLKDPVSIKYEKLSENAFSFLRGTCHLFYEDISKEGGLPTGPLAWLAGDLHLENFGSYKGANRLVYFDLNDFDQAILGPATWELARMITSIFIAFDSLKISEKKARTTADAFLETYCIVLRKGKALYLEPQTAKGIVRDFLETVSRRTQRELLGDRTCGKENHLQLLIDNDKHFKVDKDRKKKLQQHIAKWLSTHKKLQQYFCADIAFRNAGLGSLGMHRYCILLQHAKKPKTYLLLDMKESVSSCLSPYNTTTQPVWFSEAERVCSIQQCMQNISPALLSPTRLQKADYVIKELQPSSDKIDFRLLKKSHRDLSRVVTDMAILLASAQIRSSGRKGSASADELVVFGNDTSWQEKLLAFCQSYSLVTKNYFVDYQQAYADGIFNE